MAVNVNATKLANLFDPEVIGNRIDKKLFNAIKFAPLAVVDTNLEGRPGSTLTLPVYNAIGNAEIVGEGQDIPIKQLTEDTVDVRIHKIGIGVEFTDESLLSGYGDPLSQGIDQMAKSIAAKVDKDCITMLDQNANVQAKSSDLVADVADALVKFGEDGNEGAVLLVSAAAYATLRKSSAWVAGSDVGANVIMNGVVGSIYGCQVVVSDNIASTGNFYIVKPGALAIYLKRDTMVETDRDIIAKSTVVTADKHYVVYLLEPKKAVTIGSKVTYTKVTNPQTSAIDTYYEQVAMNEYAKTTDEEVVEGKTYYTVS